MSTHRPRSAKEVLDGELDESVLSSHQVRIWFLASAGIGVSGYDLFVMSVAIPLIQAYFQVFSPAWAGIFAGAAFLGAVPGAVIAGMLSDRFGRRKILVVSMILLTITSILSSLSWSPASLVVFRALQGLAIGAEYPLSASLVGEIMPRKNRGKWMTGAFSFQAGGMTIAAMIATLILFLDLSENAWRWMLLSCSVPSFLLAINRRKLKESPRWLIRKGRCEEAKEVLHWLLQIKTPMACDRFLQENLQEKGVHRGHLYELWGEPFRSRTLLTAIPWFLMDISLYGIGLFTPTILLELLHKKTVFASGFLGADFAIDTITAIADLFFIVGFLLNILTVDKYGRIKLQILGFLGMTLGITIVSLLGTQGHELGLIFGFSLFNLMVNFGPNATTYLLPVEVFPTRLRATGHGFSAAMGKAGACLGVFFLPIAKQAWGLSTTLTLIGVLSMIGAVITLLFRVETKGLPLE